MTEFEKAISTLAVNDEERIAAENAIQEVRAKRVEKIEEANNIISEVFERVVSTIGIEDAKHIIRSKLKELDGQSSKE